MRNKKMKDITFIIPINDSVDTDKFKRAYDSVVSIADKNNIIISGKQEGITKVRDLCNEGAILNSHSDNLTYFNRLNHDIEDIETEWFSIVDPYDVVDNNLIKNFETYSKHFMASAYVPLYEMIDNNNQFKGFANEIAWSPGFCDEQGYLDEDSIKSYYDFYLFGAIINTKDFIESGSFNDEYKIVAFYEALLRFVNNVNNVFIIPKIGYSRTIDNEDTYFIEYDNSDITDLITKAKETNND